MKNIFPSGKKKNINCTITKFIDIILIGVSTTYGWLNGYRLGNRK